MSKIEINAQFDTDYVDQLNSQIREIVKQFSTYFETMQVLSKKIETQIKTINSQDGSGKPLPTVPVTEENDVSMTKNISTIYAHRLELIQWVKTVIYYSEMRMMPFSIETEGNKSFRLISSIISLLNTHMASLFEINEYRILEISIDVRSNNHSRSDMIDIENNKQLEKYYQLLQYLKRYTYILHNLQKAIYVIRSVSDNYKHNIEQCTGGMYQSRPTNIWLRLDSILSVSQSDTVIRFGLRPHVFQNMTEPFEFVKLNDKCFSVLYGCPGSSHPQVLSTARASGILTQPSQNASPMKTVLASAEPDEDTRSMGS